jgi:hypothetical protein
VASSTLRSDRKAPCALRAPAMSDGFARPGALSFQGASAQFFFQTH